MKLIVSNFQIHQKPKTVETPERPTACPTCRSVYWDKERVYKQRNVGLNELLGRAPDATGET